MFCKKFCKMFCKDFSLTREFSWDGLFLFPIFKRVLLFSNTKLKNTSLLVLHYQYPQQCGDRSHQVDDQEYLWPRPENAKGCSLCFLREINRTNFLRQYVFFMRFVVQCDEGSPYTTLVFYFMCLFVFCRGCESCFIYFLFYFFL